MPGLILDWDTCLRLKRSLSKENILGIEVRTAYWGQTVKRSWGMLRYLRNLPNLRILHLSHYGNPLDPEPAIRNLAKHLGDFRGLEQLTLRGCLPHDAPLGI